MKQKKFRTLALGLCALAMLSAGTAVIYTANAPTGAVEAEAAAKFIGKAKAKQIALDHAGFAAEDVSFDKVKKEKDDGRWEYEVEFYKGSTEYEYTIHAKTGKILDYSTESRKDYKKTEKGTYIGFDKAKSLALEKAGVSAAKAHFTKAELDTDDGEKVYELDFYTSSHEYDVTVRATDGKILEFEKEDRDDD